MIRAKIDSFAYPGGEVVLRDIDMHIRAGEFVVLAGLSGSGKSTLGQCLTGVIPHFAGGRLEGLVEIMGQDLAGLELPAISAFAGYVGQEPQNQLFSLSVYDDVAFGPENLELGRNEICSRVQAALEFVGASHLAERNPCTLSGGEMQKCALASYLAMGQRVMVLDQPCRELDPLARRMVYENLGRVNREKGVTLVVLEDRPAELTGLADRLLVLEAGRVIIDEAAGAFKLNSALAGLGLLPLYGTTSDRNSAEGVRERGNDPPVAAVEGVTFGYEQDTALLKEVSFRVHGGEVTSLLGSNGAGKTTLARLLAGILKPARGTVSVRGRTGYLFQNPDHQLFGSSLFDEIAFSLRREKTPPDQVRAKVAAVLSMVGLGEIAADHPYTLSRGQRKLLALAAAMVAEPLLLIADEPTAGLDCRQSALVADIFKAFSRRGGAVLMISHDLDLVPAISQRALLLDGGFIREVQTDGFISAISR